jgi:hypothetical protein
MKKISLLLVFLSLVACQEPSDIYIDEYYNLGSFWADQKEKISSEKPEFFKEIELNGEKSELKSKEIDWTKELELFSSCDINLSAMKGCYDEQKTDSSIVYTLKADKEQYIRKIIIDFKEAKPSRFEAEIHTDNFLYSSERTISASFVSSSLMSYHIKGWQELFIGSRKDFEINGKRISKP